MLPQTSLPFVWTMDWAGYRKTWAEECRLEQSGSLSLTMQTTMWFRGDNRVQSTAFESLNEEVKPLELRVPVSGENDKVLKMSFTLPAWFIRRRLGRARSEWTRWTRVCGVADLVRKGRMSEPSAHWSFRYSYTLAGPTPGSSKLMLFQRSVKFNDSLYQGLVR